MRKLAIFALALALVFSLATMAAAIPLAPIFTISTDLNDFSSCMLQDFDENMLNPGVSVVSTNGYIDASLDQWVDFVVTGATTTWTFTPQITGWGGYFDLNPEGIGSGIHITADGYDVGDVTVNGFWGFFSTEPLTNVMFSNVSPGQEHFYLDDMRYCPVPVPPAVWLLGSGLLGLMGLRRKLKA
jgi:hypothetical protein